MTALFDADGRALGPGGRVFTAEQATAVTERGGSLLLAANAGSGKTTVLAERFVRAVVEDGIGPSSMLAITFTDKAAGELRKRIRDRLIELGRRDDARAAEAAWISTIHSFCARVLRAHAVVAGLDPAFTVLDEAVARTLRVEAFERAFAAFLADADGEPRHDALDLAAAWRADRLFKVILAVHEELRSQGQSSPRLPPAPASGDEAADTTLALLGELLIRFAAEYAGAKAAASALDYDDLELGARDLFEAAPEIAAAYAQRFERIMVDEFQDTNPRQVAIVDQLDRGAVFYVGDELQSIYGFRHADVDGFRRKRDELPSAVLATNWRSRPEILELLNGAFGDLHENYTPLEPGLAGSNSGEPLVELLLTDRDAWDAAETDEDGAALRARMAAGLPDAKPARHAEARAVARRVRRLVDDESVAPEDVVILTRAATDQGLYEQALELEGLSTLASGGRGFWARRQVQDLLACVGAVANPADEASLWALLASPLCGISSDGLALATLRVRERGDSLWAAIDDDLGTRLGAEDRERLARFREWFRNMRALAPRLGLAELLERVIADTSYDLHVLGLPGGRRRMANVHKLIRLAAGFELRRGRDVRGFIDHAAAELEAEAREPEAPVELGELRAVRLMTIHAAKGLEFGVVVLADLGRRGQGSVGDILVDGDRVGIRRVGAGEDPGGAFAYDDLKAESQLAARAEERRVFHVALTRAQDRLILSGAACLDKPWPGDGPGAPPFAWLGPALAPSPAALVAPPASVVDLHETRATGRVRMRVVRIAPDSAGAELASAAPEPGAIPAAGPAAQLSLVMPTPVIDSGARPLVGALSYSSLASYARCGYRFYLEKVLGLAREDDDLAGARGGGGELDGRMRGTLAHELLEALDLGAPGPPGAGDVRAVAATHGVELSDDEVADLIALVEGFARSELCARLGAATDVRREHGFAFGLGDPGDAPAPLVVGFVDARAREGDRALVVDYKSDRVAAHDDLGALVERDYGAQKRIYALAELRAGASEVEVAYAFLERPDEPIAERFAASDAPRLERELGALAEGIGAGRFEVTPEPHRRLCAGCPGRGGMCSWDTDVTSRELDVQLGPEQQRVGGDPHPEQ